MKYSKLSLSGHQIETKNYTLTLFDGLDPARLALHKSIQEYWFFPGGSVNAVGKSDAGTVFGKWRKKETEDSLVFTRTERSLLWKEKKTTVICREKSLEIFLSVTGNGSIEDVRFFRVCVNGVEYGFAGECDEVVNTAPNFHGRIYYHPVESFSISAGDDLSVAVGGQALASCCPCIALRDRSEQRFLVAGAAAVPGENTWDGFRWNPSAVMPATAYEGDQIRGGGFSLEYCGRKKISGSWRTPSLLLSFCNDQDDILPSYLKECYALSYLEKPRRKPVRNWWRSPIYCTWHDQCAASMLDQSNYIGCQRPHAREFCTEELVEEWLGALIGHDCKPGIVILDDKWQLNLNDADPDTAKFPDMRGWIERCHRRGIRVFLWTAAWNNDHIPLDEAVTRNGKVVCGDITNPKYEARFRRMIRGYFSAGKDGLNADGVKMDGLLGLPVGPGLKNHENLWGLELQKRYLDILYEEAHKTKPEVCVSTFAAHPYLAATSDMVRLADMYHSRLSPLQSMRQRALVYAAAMPYALIDTDGQFQFCIKDHPAELLAEQLKLGIPTIYNGKLLRQNRFFLPARYGELTEDDYALISQIFKAQYRKL
jgi:hypothetical protein